MTSEEENIMQRADDATKLKLDKGNELSVKLPKRGNRQQSQAEALHTGTMSGRQMPELSL
jgi:hypothetical protein